MMDYRKYYAAMFNTLDFAVRYWHELDTHQQDQAGVMFAGLGTLDMPQHVYNVGLTGGIVSRRPLHPNDPARNQVGDE